MAKFFFIISLLFIRCSNTHDPVLGSWTAELALDTKKIPFEFELMKKDTSSYLAYFINASERLEIDDVIIDGDSLKITMGVFDAELKAKYSGDSLSGVYYRYFQNYFIPFVAKKSKPRFEIDKKTASKIDGKWEVFFTDKDGSFPAIGVFEQKGNNLNGTFITETGDYRFLDGVVVDNKLKLSAFDGSHAFLFEAELVNDTLRGGFWSGNHYYASWTGFRNEDFELKNPDSITYLKAGYDRLSFKFPNENKDSISLSEFYGKPTIVQILGSWCPNCMDETKFLTAWISKNQDLDLQIVGLAYEYNDFDYASKRVKRMKEKFEIPYPILIAGNQNKKKASATLPMLNEIVSFPTMIFLDRNHNIQRIHTGFNGPSTGQLYESFQKGFEKTIKKITQ